MRAFSSWTSHSRHRRARHDAGKAWRFYGFSVRSYNRLFGTALARRRNTKSDAELADLRNAGRRRSPLEALRARCLDCCAGIASEVDLCPAKTCASWPYRFGVDPWSATELPPKAAAEVVQSEPVLAPPSVEITQAATSAKRTWRQTKAIYVDSAVNIGIVNNVATEHSDAIGRGDDATDDITPSIVSKVAAPAKRKRGRPRKVEQSNTEPPQKRKRGRPPKQRSLFE